MGTVRPVARAATTFDLEHSRLGPLTEFPGSWVGTGFNLISRPDFHDKQPNNHSFWKSMARWRLWPSP
jgi:hypothetical protein